MGKAEWSTARSWLADVRYYDLQPRSQTPTVAEADTYYQDTLRPIAPHLWPRETPGPEPTPVEDVAARHGMSQAQWDALSPVERRTRDRLQREREGQAPPVRSHPYRPAAPLEVRKQWETLPLTEQVTKYRQWCDTQTPH